MAKSKAMIAKAKAPAVKPKVDKTKPTQKKRPAVARKAKSSVAERAPTSAAAAPSPAPPPSERIQRLWEAVAAVRKGSRDSPRTARLLAAGPPKMAQKVVEEAAEVAIEAVAGEKTTLVNESVDLIYNLTVLWNTLGVEPRDIWAEMDRREATLGMAEKLPKTDDGI